MGYIAEHYAPAAQKLFCERFGAGGRVSGRWFRVTQERPAAGSVSGAGGASAAFSAAALGIEQGAQILESIGGYQTGGD
jgi:hypothetical protein